TERRQHQRAHQMAERIAGADRGPPAGTYLVLGEHAGALDLLADQLGRLHAIGRGAVELEGRAGDRPVEDEPDGLVERARGLWLALVQQHLDALLHVDRRDRIDRLVTPLLDQHALDDAPVLFAALIFGELALREEVPHRLEGAAGRILGLGDGCRLDGFALVGRVALLAYRIAQPRGP